MEASVVFVLVTARLLKVSADVTFVQLPEKQSVELSCPPLQDHGGLASVHLYHRRGQSQTTLLSLARGSSGELRLDPDYKRRLQLSGRNSSWVKVTLSHLEQGDSGLYVCENLDRENGSQRVFITQEVFLLVDASGKPCRCSSSYPPLLMTIFAAAGLVLLMLAWLAVQERVKTRRPPPPAPPAVVPIYEEMTRKQQKSGVPLIKREVLEEELTSPLYANTSVRQTQDNYYACPRHVTTLRA
ncbi:uncharacterized protein LOC133514706 [Syngnathoides biaculeatus]|uniref:uncharacterized protein LOC133514706 n=1 Tax=Syngnathoides biaculeatus TaxID=300417 RepID=UPI002ADE4F1B|nr:uncharacterized protein LOC133514706 [Syngnathoides biaculeatus]